MNGLYVAGSCFHECRWLSLESGRMFCVRYNVSLMAGWHVLANYDTYESSLIEHLVCYEYQPKMEDQND